MSETEHKPRWFKHLDNRETGPTDRAFQFREMRLPKIPPAYRNYTPRQAPTITMLAPARAQPPEEAPPLRSYEQGETGNWNNPEPGKRAAHLNRARRRATKKETAA